MNVRTRYVIATAAVLWCGFLMGYCAGHRSMYKVCLAGYDRIEQTMRDKAAGAR